MQKTTCIFRTAMATLAIEGGVTANMEQQEINILNGFYKNATVGMDATCSILSKASHPKLRSELCQQLQYYHAQKQNVQRQMRMHGIAPTETGKMAKFCADLSIRMHCCGDTSSSEIAALMLKGTTAGTIQLTQLLHQYPEAPDHLKRQAKEIICHEETYMERLKPYL